MLRKSFLWVVLTAVLPFIPVSAETVDEIIARNIEVRGGMEALAEVESARVVGKLSIDGMELLYTLEWKRPNRVRLAYEMQGMKTVRAFDGGERLVDLTVHGWF